MCCEDNKVPAANADGKTKEIQVRKRVAVCNVCTGKDLCEEFPELFKPGLGACRTYQVESMPFKTGIHIKQQGKPPSLGRAEDDLVWKEMEKLLEDEVIQEVQTEPDMIPAFCEPKKRERRLVLDFRKLNSYIQKEPYLRTNRDHTISAVEPSTLVLHWICLKPTIKSRSVNQSSPTSV